MTEQDRIFAKCARRLIPWMVLLYLINNLDRVNIGFAALTMNKDLGITPSQYGFAASVFSVGYFLFQVPANLILQKVGARRWVACMMVAWGLVSASNAFIQGPASFYAIRFILGIAECGLYPAMLIYLTLWFPQAYRGRFTALFMVSLPLSFMLGGPISTSILGMEGIGGLHGWQWVFLLEGLPAPIIALLLVLYFPDGPRDAAWLSVEEKTTIAALTAADEAGARHRDLWPALLDWRVPALGLVTFGLLMGYYGVGLWLPQIVRAMGYSNFATGFVAVPVYAAGIAAMIPWGRHSDKTGDRVWHVALPALLAAAGLVAASLLPGSVFSLVALAATAMGLCCMSGPFWSLVSSALRGTAAAGGLAIINAVGGLGAFPGPYLMGVLREQTGSYEVGIAALALGPLLSALVVLTLGRALVVKPASAH